jgi:hypothetical protein
MPRGGPTTRSSRPTYDLTARDQGAWGEQEAPSRLCTGLRRTALGALLWSRAASAVRYNSEEEIRARITRLPRRHARRRRPSSGPKSQKSTPDARLGARFNRAFSLDFDIVMQQIRRRFDVRRLQRVIHVILRVRRRLPVYPDKQTSSEPVGMSQTCQKPTSPGANAEDATVIPAAQPCEARLSDVCGRLKACTAPLAHSAKLRTQA